MVALMFGVMVTGLTWQLYARSSRQESYFSPLAKAYGEFGRLQTRSHDKALTGDVLELMGLYTRAQAIHPDSLTARDSTFLVDLDKQLNSIINEKD
ncbi:hypothetical protein [Pontibacter ummariensis]|nr:hypothetical protein [Pontibacter ummariensis]